MARLLVVVTVVLLGAACGRTPGGAESPAAAPVVADVLVFLTREGCVNTDIMRANLDGALAALGWRGPYPVIDLDTLPDADPRRGYPTPTALYGGHDLFDLPEPTPPYRAPT